MEKLKGTEETEKVKEERDKLKIEKKLWEISRKNMAYKATNADEKIESLTMQVIREENRTKELKEDVESLKIIMFGNIILSTILTIFMIIGNQILIEIPNLIKNMVENLYKFIMFIRNSFDGLYNLVNKNVAITAIILILIAVIVFFAFKYLLNWFLIDVFGKFKYYYSLQRKSYKVYRVTISIDIVIIILIGCNVFKKSLSNIPINMTTIFFILSTLALITFNWRDIKKVG